MNLLAWIIIGILASMFLFILIFALSIFLHEKRYFIMRDKKTRECRICGTIQTRCLMGWDNYQIADPTCKCQKFNI